MPRIPVNGVQYNVEVGGEGPPLVLLHGFTGSTRTWDPFLPAFRERHTTVAIDLLGHGRSDAPDDPERYRMEHAVEDLAGVLAVFGQLRPAVLGYSMGGRVALALAVAYPQLISALVLEGATPGIADAEERRERVWRDGELADSIERGGLSNFIARWEGMPLFATQASLPTCERARLREQRLRNSATGLANSLRGMGAGAQEPLWSSLEQVDTPALLVAGSLDNKFRGIAERMASTMPCAWTAHAPDAGHAAHLENRDAFERLVREFLRDHPSNCYRKATSIRKAERSP